MAKPSFEEFEKMLDVVSWKEGFVRTLYNSLTRPDWTPVEQGLPETSGTVQVTCRESGVTWVSTAHYSCQTWSWPHIIAWAPLPQPYEPTDE